MTAKFCLLILAFLVFIQVQHAQQSANNATKFIFGLSAPELLHAGIAHRLANASQLAVNAGIGPSFGGVWSSISLEHRLYLGRPGTKDGQKLWFFRQGTTYFPAAESGRAFTFNLTAGKDLPFKKPGRGMTIDAGVFYLPQSERSSIILVRSLNLWPAIRFELYFPL